MTFLRRWLILSHRYLGIALSLVFVVWFASGIVMIYAGGMPRLTPQLRLERLPALDLSRVRLAPTDAAEQATLGRIPDRVAVLTIMDRPAYRFPSGAGPTTVFADNGEVLEEVDLEQARTIAGRFMNLPVDDIRYVRTLTQPDQWTLIQGRAMPQHKFRVDDEAGTELYVSPYTGDVSVHTTRRARTLAWIGTIPHWFYFAPLRLNAALWTRAVVWTAGLGCVLALFGLILGVIQFKRSRPFAASIPYAGWMRWHYITGVIFGVFTLTWAYSGLLSMEPFEWTTRTGLEVSRDVFTGGPLDLSRFPAVDPAAWDRLLGGRAIKEMELVRIQDDPYYVVRLARDEQAGVPRPERLHQPYNVTGVAEPDRLLVAANTFDVRREPFSADSLMARLRTALPDVPIVESQVLSEYDSYYYSRGRQTPLPVLRVKFADPEETWFYIDPQMSQLLARVHRLNRVERWLYSGLHNLDFSFWYNRRPLWDIGVILLSLGGLASSGIGLYLGIKRVRRGVKGVVRSPRSSDAIQPVPEGVSQ